MRAALVCLSCFVAWGFGFCHTGLWARPRPGALGGSLVMPREIWSGPVLPVLPPPKFPGVAMGSCLNSTHNTQHTTHNTQLTAVKRYA
jgi:hypothetical protein